MSDTNKKSPEKRTIVMNGVTLWSQSYDRMVFARQLEPSQHLQPDDPEATLRTPIIIGYDGEQGRDLANILKENEDLKKRVYNLEERIERDEEWELQDLQQKIERIERRVETIDKRTNGRWIRLGGK